MKRKNNKLLTLMLAGVLCAATAGTVAATLPLDASADTTAQSYALNTVFNTNATASTIAGKNGKTALTFGNENSVEYDRNIAIKWFEGKGVAKYMTLKFTFEDVNFTEMAFAFEAAPMQATKEDTSVNTVKFVKAEDNKVSVKVINGDEDEALVTAYETAIVAGSSITLSLAEAADLGSYQVNLAVGDATAENVGTFTNVGAKYFNTDDMESLVISAKTAGDAKTVLFVENINGQDFNNVSEDNKVTDTAAPVLVVNEDVKGFLLGAQFELDYKEIDVLDSTITSDTAKTYYQYNPADEKAEYTSKLLSSTYFMDTVLYTNGTEYSKTEKDGFTKTSVFREWEKKNNAANNGRGGEEFVSIRFTLKDDTYKGEETDTHPQNVIDLAWYAESDALVAFTLDGTETDYIVLNRSTAGPAYTAWTGTDVTEYEAKLAKKAEKVYAGSNSEIELPAVDWLIKDENNGYQSLQFTISYKTPSSSSAKTSSNLDADDLEISASEAGWYEFKIFASDVAGNAMYVDKLDEDGNVVTAANGDPVKVKVTTSNVWDLDNVPSFLYEVKSQGIKTADNEDNDTLDTQILGETYTMTAIDIVGATTEKSNYALYALNLGAYNGAGTITTDKLSGIKFAALKMEMDKLIADELAKENMTADKVDFMELSKQAYVNLVAKAIGGEAKAEDVAKIFTPIAEYNDRITEENETAWAESDNKYNWKASSRSFKAVESGLYLIVADYWDDEMLFAEHAPAYQLVEVASEADVIKGETEWLKNNLVSVILFSVAAVMLILIIILLLVKPSDETLEDIDEKVVAKRKQATDKHKKN